MAVSQLDAKTGPRFTSEARQGFFYGLGAYLIWGLATGYYALMPHIPPFEIVAHRAAWAVPLGTLVLYLIGGGRAALSVLRNWRLMRVLVVTATIIAANWSVFIWAISTNRMLDASLAYFINPLMSVAIGFALLGERLSKAQIVAIGLATIAVVFETVAEGVVPWLALFLASSFAVYGYLRKTVPVGAVEGFLIEAMLMSPVAVGVILWFEIQGQGHLFTTPLDALYLMFCAIFTGVPLMMFGAAARRLTLSAIGLMQYIGPSIGFVIAVFVFHEPLDTATLLTFILIWTALVIFSWSALRRRGPPAPGAAPA